MTTIADLVDTEPDPAFGVEAGFPALAGGGVWRAVLELADPSAGSSVEWFDITDYFTGYEYTRGSDSFLGRYRAGIVTLDLYATDDRLAPWNDDTSATFGVNVQLGAGILLRFGFIRVEAGVVEEWNPRWTCRVQLWADAAYSQGKIRRHRIIARDTLTALVNVPIPADTEENWTNRVSSVLTAAGWEYGSTIYGPTTIGGVGILPLPDRAAQTSAINELDASVDPAGAVWYTNRRGQLIVRPSVYDTWLASKFDPGGAAGTPYPEADPVTFAWWACTGEEPPGDYGDLDTLDVAAYAMDTPGVDPFGLDRSELAVINHVVITSPSGTYDDDNPTSVQRYDRHTLQASWITANDFVADDILAARANATLEARPLTANIRLDGFQLGPSYVDYLDPVDIWHRNGDTGMEAHAEGWLRGYRERVRPLGCDTDWSITLTLDVFESSSRDVFLLPVIDLTLTDVSDLAATFTWGNPTQVVTPTHTQVRMNGDPIWTTIGYPLTGLTWSGLTPYTPYEFEVRLIRVVDELITHFSPTRSVVFMTADPDVPVIDVDPDDPDTVIVTPPAPDDPEDCILEWELQESADGETGWTTIDDGTETVPPYTFAIDLTGLDTDKFYRVQTREVCGGVPGDWAISAFFPPTCMPVSQLGVPPFDDANLVAYWPQVCPDSIAEAVSDEPMTLGFAWDRAEMVDGLPVMYSFGEGVIGYGINPVTVPGDSDLSIAIRVNFGTLPAGNPIIFGYGGLYFTVEASGSDWIVEGHALELGVGTITITGFTTQDLNTEYTLLLTHEVDGILSLYVDETLVDASVSNIGERATPLGGLYQIGAPADSWVTDAAVWDVVLSPAFSPSDIADLEVWYDAADAATFVFGTGTLVAAWNDKSGNGHHQLQATGANQPNRNGTINSLDAVDFDGSNDFLRTAGNVQFVNTSTNDWTAFAVVETDSVAAGTAYVVDGDNGSGTGRVAQLIRRDQDEPGTLQLTTGGASISDVSITNGLVVATPTLLRSMCNGTTIQAWQEGVSDGSTSLAGGTPRSTAVQMSLGAGFATTAAAGFWNGRIAEVIVYRRALTGPEIASVETYLRDKWATPTIAASLSAAVMALSPVGYWKLDDPSGTTAVDASGNGRDGTYSGTYALATHAGGDGVNYSDFGTGGTTWGRVSIADNAAFSADTASGMTVRIFARPEATELGSSTQRRMITKGVGAAQYEWELIMGGSAAGVVRHNYYSLAGNVIANEGLGGTLTASAWSMIVAASVSPTNAFRYDLYVDTSGPLTSSQATTAAGSYGNGTSTVDIARRADVTTGGWHGGLAHAAIFAGKLTSAQITSIRLAAIAQGWTTV